MDVKKDVLSRCTFCKCCFAGKSGQLTVFMILGILILFVFAGIFYLTNLTVEEGFLADTEPTSSVVPKEFEPVLEYTENCIENIAKEGLILLGEQGGHIYPETLGDYSEDDPTNSEGIVLGSVNVPYWHYNINPNEAGAVVYTSHKPDLVTDENPVMSIEGQLESYVEENLDSCLVDYITFVDQGFEIVYTSSVDNKNMEVKVGDDYVGFFLQMPLEVTKGEAQTDMSDYYVKVPLNLKHYYEVAEEIAFSEYEYNYLEHQALDLLASHSGLEDNLLPPSESVSFENIAPVTWDLATVEETFKGMLMSYVPMLRYYGSKNFYRYDYDPDPNNLVDLDNLFQKNYDNMIIPLDSAQDLNVNYDYFGWDIYLDMNDDQGTIKPRSVFTSFMKLKLNTHHYYTNYHVSYPVLVTLEDDDAFDGEGYKFNIALEANIRNNDIIKEGDTIPAPVVGLSESMVCDEDKMNTELITSHVVDSFTGESLDLVQIGFSVPNVDNCMMGETDFSGKHASEYPAVIGGVNSYMKDDYLTNFYPVDTYEYKEQPGIFGYAVAGFDENVVEMHRYKTIDFDVKLKPLTKCLDYDCEEDDEDCNPKCYGSGDFATFTEEDLMINFEPEKNGHNHSWYFSDTSGRKLKGTETATVVLNRIGDIEGVQNDDFTGNGIVIGNGTGEIELVPGIYNLMVMVVDNDGLRIPPDNRSKDIKMEEEILDKYPSGSTHFNLDENYIMITPEMLYSSDKITFYGIGFGIKNVPEEEGIRVLEDLQVMGQLINYSQILRGVLEPSYDIYDVAVEQ